MGPSTFSSFPRSRMRTASLEQIPSNSSLRDTRVLRVEHSRHRAKDTEAPQGCSVAATVGLDQREDGGYGLAVTLEVSTEGVSSAEAEELVSTAHNVMCPYSNAIRGNVDVAIDINDSDFLRNRVSAVRGDYRTRRLRR
jgi:hypothetical protein